MSSEAEHFQQGKTKLGWALGVQKMSLQVYYDQILGFWGHDEFKVRVYGGFLVASISYWTIGSIFTFVDYTGYPKFLMKYKVQENVKTYPISRAQLTDLVVVVMFNQLLAIPLLAAMYYFDQWRGAEFQRELPGLFTTIGSIPFFGIVNEVLFYYGHRFLHHPAVYKRIHKKHHTWISPVAISAIYCHPFEQLFTNLIPVVLGSVILQSHPAVLWLYTVLATIEVLTVHSGFHLPFLKSPEFHDFHHLKFNYNFGVFGIMDYLHGTDSMFRASKQFLRHKRTFTTTPVKVLIP